jgi:hypothetical protein
MEEETVSRAALLEIQVILERYLAYSMNAVDSMDKILAVLDRPEVALALDPTPPTATDSRWSRSFASFP